MKTLKTVFAAAMLLSAVACAPKQEEEAGMRPIIGADISWVPFDEAKGRQFSENGVQKDILEILGDNGFNWIRLRLFVDPAAEGGYSPEGYCGLESTLDFARRVKEAGMKLLLDFHYSDDWADPQHQIVPSSWAELDAEGLVQKMYDYTLETLRRFASEGVSPDMVQIGNEINHGFVWPIGQLDDDSTDFDTFCVLLKSASEAVREADPAMTIMVHIALGGQNEESVKFLDEVLAHGVDFDVIGESYYPRWHGTLEDLENNLNDLVKRYDKDIIVVEYQDFKREVNEIVAALPDGRGLGTFIWEAASPEWGNLFDPDGSANENLALYPEMSALYAE